MQRAFERWPIAMRDARPPNERPQVSFLIGHRGNDRLPHLLATLRSIAGQRDLAIECIVVEQSWVRYIHTPLPRRDLPYCRSWAFNVAARHARGETLIFHDNDVLVPAAYASESLARIRDGWQFLDLKRFLFYLSSKDTAQLFAREIVRTDIVTTISQNLRGGSIVAARGAFESIGGFDEAFVGWGGEDNDFWDRAETTGRVYAFGYLPMIHLHHPQQPGKWKESTPGVARYREIESIPAAERIARLLERKQGRMGGPVTDA